METKVKDPVENIHCVTCQTAYIHARVAKDRFDQMDLLGAREVINEMVKVLEECCHEKKSA